jgi:cytochrome c oxidase accessory protein FixG
MFDRDTLVISYDAARGEPRGHRSRAKLQAVNAAVVSAQTPALGDCIDCLACVQVCPTGIDIRNGLQIDCIACAACIDACDAVMDKVGYARGLIRYTTEHELAGQPRRILRPRIFIYAGILLALVGAFAWAVIARAPVIVEVLHDRNGLFRNSGRGTIENSYNVKLVNKADHAIELGLRAEGDLPLILIGTSTVALDPGEVFSLPLTLRADAGAMHGRTPITIAVIDANGTVVARGKAHFFAPES